MRQNKIGQYREFGEYKEVLSAGINAPVFADSVEFRFKYSNGEGLTKEEFNAFQSWIVQTGSYVIETSENWQFNKGDKLIIEGGENLIQRVIEKQDHTRLNGRKQNKRKVKVIFCG